MSREKETKKRNLQKRNMIRIVLLAAVVVVAVVVYLFINSHPEKPKMFRYILSLRIPTLICMVIASIAIGAATLIFKSIVNNRIVTPALLGMNSIYSFLHTAAVFVMGTGSTLFLNANFAFAVDLLLMGVIATLVYWYLFRKTVVYLGVDYEKGVVQSTADNAKTIASIFGKEAEIDAKMTGFQERIDALKTVIAGKDVLLSMYNNNAMSIMDTESQLNIIAKEMGGNNLGETVGEVEKATHGEDASWETIVSLNPEYIFVLDRSTATGAADEGILGAKEVIENDLIKELDVYKNGKIVYFIEHANVWYTSTGGIQALDTMLADLEAALLN